MRFDDELAKFAELLRVGAEAARTIAQARGRDEAVILDLAAQAETMAETLDRIIGASDGYGPQPVETLRLKRDK